MPDRPTYDAGPLVRIEQLRYGLQQHVGSNLVASVRVEQVRDMVTDDMVVRLTASLLAEELPPVSVIDRTSFTVPRFATWYDHLVATYRDRWWARVLRWNRRALRYVDEPHSHSTDVKVRTHWTYPRATIVLPGRDFGHVVLKTQTSHDGQERSW